MTRALKDANDAVARQIALAKQIAARTADPRKKQELNDIAQVPLCSNMIFTEKYVSLLSLSLSLALALSLSSLLFLIV
jgi:hypothetical protein